MKICMKENDKYTYKRGAFFSLQHIFLLLTQLILGIFLDASASLQFFFISPALIIKLLSTFTSDVYFLFFFFRTLRNTSFSK